MNAELTRRERLKAALPPELAERPPRRGPSRTEKRITVVQVLKARPKLSDRFIATWCGVSREMVTRTRGELVAAGLIPEVNERRGADRKIYTAWPKRKSIPEQACP